jgi:hypothetical protein
MSDTHQPATSNRTLLIGFVALAVAVLALTALLLAGWAKLGDTNARVGRETASLAQTQRALVVSQKASTQTRVTTVGQRCALTRLILGVLVRVHDTRDATPFEASAKTCLAQLASVKQINARTPAPPH